MNTIQKIQIEDSQVFKGESDLSTSDNGVSELEDFIKSSPKQVDIDLSKYCENHPKKKFSAKFKQEQNKQLVHSNSSIIFNEGAEECNTPLRKKKNRSIFREKEELTENINSNSIKFVNKLVIEQQNELETRIHQWLDEQGLELEDPSLKKYQYYNEKKLQVSEMIIQQKIEQEFDVPQTKSPFQLRMERKRMQLKLNFHSQSNSPNNSPKNNDNNNAQKQNLQGFSQFSQFRTPGPNIFQRKKQDLSPIKTVVSPLKIDHQSPLKLSQKLDAQSPLDTLKSQPLQLLQQNQNGQSDIYSFNSINKYSAVNNGSNLDINSQFSINDSVNCSINNVITIEQKKKFQRSNFKKFSANLQHRNIQKGSTNEGKMKHFQKNAKSQIQNVNMKLRSAEFLY